MTLLAVIILALLWAAVFMPVVRRSSHEGSPVATVGMFRRGMRALGGRSTPAHGRWVLMPKSQDELDDPHHRVKVRRRRIFTLLVGLAAGTLLLGLIPGLRDFLRIHLAFDLMLGGYVMYLIQEKYRHSYYLPKRAIGTEEQPEQVEEFFDVEPELQKAQHF